MDRKQFFESLKPQFLASKDEEKVGLGSTSATNTQYKAASSGLTRRTNTGIKAYTGTFGDAELLHLMRRSMFGVKYGDFKKLRGKTLQQAVDAILTVPASLPNPPINNYGNLVTDPNVAYGSTWVNAPLDPAV